VSFNNQDIGNAYFDMVQHRRPRDTGPTTTAATVASNLFYIFTMRFPHLGGSGRWRQDSPPYAMWTHTTTRTPTPSIPPNVQRQFGSRTVIEAGYLGNQSHHLYGFQDANQAIPYGYLGNGFEPISTRLPYLNYG